jgi:hypothetical protein
VAAAPIPAITRTILVRGVGKRRKIEKRFAPRIRERENSRKVAEAQNSARPFPSLGTIHLMHLGRCAFFLVRRRLELRSGSTWQSIVMFAIDLILMI